MPFFHVFSEFTDHIESIVTHGGYIFLFLTTLLEGVPLVGMVVPGHVTIIIAGFLAKVNILSLGGVLALALGGALIGDCIGFYIGRRYGLSFIDRLRPYFFITDQHLEKATNLLSKHTGKALIIGRFSPVTRALMPFLVGTSRTPAKRFWIYNIIGGVSWVLTSIAVGYIFGSGYHAAAGYLGKFSVFAVITALVIMWGYRFVNIRFHIFKRYELFALILNLVSLYVLSRTIQDAWAPQSFLAGFDVSINILAGSLTSMQAWIADASRVLSAAGSPQTMIVIGLMLAVWYVFRKRWRSAAISLVAIWSTSFTIGILKTFFLRARPDNALLTIIGDPSFPSGHAALAAAVFTVIGYFLARKIHSWVWREVAIVLCVLVVIAIGVSRIILNVHWASDVIGGWALGIFCATASILAVRYIGALLVKKAS